jgi:hypothetical protein
MNSWTVCQLSRELHTATRNAHETFWDNAQEHLDWCLRDGSASALAGGTRPFSCPYFRFYGDRKRKTSRFTARDSGRLELAHEHSCRTADGVLPMSQY